MRYALQFALLCFLPLMGCASYIWRHNEHNDQARFQRDSYECERDMRQSGYYGGGIVGQINAQGFAERCMFARGYYKASREPQSQPTATAYAPPPPAVVAAPPAPVVTQPAPTPLVPNAPTVTRRFAQLYLIKGKIVSTPPQLLLLSFSTKREKRELNFQAGEFWKATSNYSRSALGYRASCES